MPTEPNPTYESRDAARELASLFSGPIERLPGRVLVVGVGALGSPAALALARAGVETVGLADPELVELSNLHRQILFTTADVGGEKAGRAAESLAPFSATRVRTHPVRVTEANVRSLAGSYDVLLDATDDPGTKFLLSDVAVELGLPLVHAGVTGFEAQILVVVPPGGACLRCAFGSAGGTDEASCRDAGVLAPLAGLVGVLQAEAACEILRGRGNEIGGRLVSIDARGPRFRDFRLPTEPGCPAHAGRRTSKESP